MNRFIIINLAISAVLGKAIVQRRAGGVNFFEGLAGDDQALTNRIVDKSASLSPNVITAVQSNNRGPDGSFLLGGANESFEEFQFAAGGAPTLKETKVGRL